MHGERERERERERVAHSGSSILDALVLSAERSGPKCRRVALLGSERAFFSPSTHPTTSSIMHSTSHSKHREGMGDG
jgi:hypothetical protein